MRKPFLILLCLMAAASFFISCSNESKMEVTDVRFYINEERSRTLGADWDKANATKYQFTLTNKNNATFTYNKTFDRNESGTYKMPGIVSGSYTVVVNALNKSGQTVATYTKDENISKTSSTFTVAITTLHGKGNLNVTFKWSASSITDHTGAQINPEVTVVLKNQSGETVSGVSVDKSKISQGQVTLSAPNLPSGSYFLNLSVNKNGVYYYGYTEVVRVSNEDVTATVDFANLGSGNISTSFGITDTTSAPITATLDVTEVGGVTTVGINYTHIPVGKTENDVNLKFYVDDYEMTTIKNADGKYPLSGFFGKGRITVIFDIPSLVGSMGSASVVYEKP